MKVTSEVPSALGCTTTRPGSWNASWPRSTAVSSRFVWVSTASREMLLTLQPRQDRIVVEAAIQQPGCQGALGHVKTAERAAYLAHYSKRSLLVMILQAATRRHCASKL